MLQELMHFTLFRELSAADLELIAPLFSARMFEAGAVIFEQGERADRLYLLARGEVVLRYKPYDGEPINLNHVRPGGVFGWSAVLGNETYSSSVICQEDCEVLYIYDTYLRSLLANHPRTGRVLLDVLARAVSSRWVNARSQIQSMLKHGIVTATPPLKGEIPMNLPASNPKVQQIMGLLEQLSAYIEQYHGGSVEFVSYDGETLRVKLGGACLGCPLSPATLHGWVQGTVRQFFPEVKTVEAVEE